MTINCNKNMPFHECELALLRTAIDKAEDIQGFKAANSSEIKDMVSVVEAFLKDESLICYGGTAINNILPEKYQFYDKKKEIPDYDFFSPSALEHAKKLADIYGTLGYDEVEAKSGQHFGTYKVYVNFIPIADITQMDPSLFKQLKRSSINIGDILYTPPNMLRMSMYLELSRPAGDISRWEKVLKRLTLLNTHYPLESKQCNYHYFTRKLESRKESIGLFNIIKNTLIDNDVVFFGGWASSVFSKYLSKSVHKQIKQYPDFDVLSQNAEETATFLKNVLSRNSVKNISIIKHKNLDEILPYHYEVKVGTDTIAFIYQTIACYSYNTITDDARVVKIATIDTMLSMYLTFIYANRSYYDEHRILCMANFLFKVQQKNRLQQKGPLKRFSINCYGEQSTKQSMRAEKTKKYKELKHDRNSVEYQQRFLNYTPTGTNTKPNAKPNAKSPDKTKKNTKKNTKKTTKKTKTSRRKISLKSLKENIKELLAPII